MGRNLKCESDRTSSTPQKRSHSLNSPKAIALPQLPKSDRTSSTPQKRSHLFNSPKAIAPLQLPKSDSYRALSLFLLSRKEYETLPRSLLPVGYAIATIYDIIEYE